MYELEPLHPAVAAQVDVLGRWAFVDYEAALTFLLVRPWDSDVFNPRISRLGRLRKFGLGRGSILYVPHPTRPTVWLESVSFLRST